LRVERRRSAAATAAARRRRPRGAAGSAEGIGDGELVEGIGTLRVGHGGEFAEGGVGGGLFSKV